MLQSMFILVSILDKEGPKIFQAYKFIMVLTSVVETFEKSRLQINFQSIDKDYFTDLANSDGNLELRKVHEFTLFSSKTQATYPGTITLIDGTFSKGISQGIRIDLEGLEKFDFNYDLIINEEETFEVNSSSPTCIFFEFIMIRLITTSLVTVVSLQEPVMLQITSIIEILLLVSLSNCCWTLFQIYSEKLS